MTFHDGKKIVEDIRGALKDMLTVRVCMTVFNYLSADV